MENDREPCCQSSIGHQAISRKGKHCAKDENDHVEEYEFGTKEHLGNRYVTLRYPGIGHNSLMWPH